MWGEATLTPQTLRLKIIHCFYHFASLSDLMARNRWTAVWLTVHTGMAVKAPPMVKVQNVFRTLGSGLKLKQLTHSYSLLCA